MRTTADREKLFNANEKLAFSACADWCRRHSGFIELYRLEREDLDSIALMALWAATDKWTPRRGAFSTLAVLTIHSRLSHVLTNHNRAKRGAGLPEPLRLDARIAGSESSTLADVIAAPDDSIPERAVIGSVVYADIWARVDDLPAVQAQAIRMHYGSDISFQGAADKLGISRQALQNRANRGLALLRVTCEDLGLCN